MTRITAATATVWDKLNPSEPDTAYLVRFMAVALTVFAIGLGIGHF
ncbi:hypothetical protein ACW9UR_17280 [Halovulum sp. GXIMD14794]